MVSMQSDYTVGVKVLVLLRDTAAIACNWLALGVEPGTYQGDMSWNARGWNAFLAPG